MHSLAPLFTGMCYPCPPACCSLVAVPCFPHPPLLSRFVFSRGGPDRTLDLTYNKLYGQFPRFLVNQAADLSDSCLCATNFTVSAGNQLYCPTKDSLEGVKVTPSLLETFKQANYTCLLPKQKEPVSGAGVSWCWLCTPCRPCRSLALLAPHAQGCRVQLKPTHTTLLCACCSHTTYLETHPTPHASRCE